MIILKSLNGRLMFYSPQKEYVFPSKAKFSVEIEQNHLFRSIEEIWQDFQDFKNDVNFYGRFQFWPLKPNLASA